MDKKSVIAATIFAATLPALAGTVMQTSAAPVHKPQQKHAPAVKPAGLLTPMPTANRPMR